MSIPTIYVRVPEVLKRDAERAAEVAGQSLNTWMMRLIEKGIYLENNAQRTRLRLRSIK